MKRLLYLVLSCLVMSLCVGCARLQTRMMKAELQQVAKRWCLTIRASQVVPVYPLTEDLQPGDVFLVDTPIPQQVREYTSRGYLPLDLQFYRFPELSYETFYQDAYFAGDYSDGVPHPRPEPDAFSAEDNALRFELAKLPAAAFPDYTFKSKQGIGTRLAIPVNGVPVGMSFLGSSDVRGSIKLSDAYTYGVDQYQLLERLYEWADSAIGRAKLARIRGDTKDRLFLRVVNRVFLVGGVTVSLQAGGATSAGVDVGAAEPLDPFSMTREEAEELQSVAEAFSSASGALSEALNEALPGGSVRFASANRGTVTMQEQFGRLLVIGYLGFDIEIDRHGRLGPPVATLGLLENRPGAEERLLTGLSPQSREVVERHVIDLYEQVLTDELNRGEPFETIRAHLNAFGKTVHIPEGLWVYEQTPEGLERTNDMRSAVGDRTGFDRYVKFYHELDNSKDALNIETEDKVKIADRERLEEASAELAAHFETSFHVAEALRLYCEEVLMPPKKNRR